MKNDTTNMEKITDLNYLIDISKGNKVFVKEMINLFLSENPEEIKCLEKGIQEKNYDQIKATAHKLRSTIPFIGLDKLIEKDVIGIETLAAQKGDIQEIEKHFMKIKETCERAYFELYPV